MNAGTTVLLTDEPDEAVLLADVTADHAGGTVRVVSGRTATRWAGFADQVISVLALPDWTGRGWGSLRDGLTGVPSPGDAVVLVVAEAVHLLVDEPTGLEGLAVLLRGANEEGETVPLIVVLQAEVSAQPPLVERLRAAGLDAVPLRS